MAGTECQYKLMLKHEEVLALKKLLGGMTDPEFAKFGIKGNERAMKEQ